MARTTTLTKEQIDQIVSLLEQGQSIRQVAAALSVSKNQVETVLNNYRLGKLERLAQDLPVRKLYSRQTIAKVKKREQKVIESDFDLLITVNRILLSRLSLTPDEFSDKMLVDLARDLADRFEQRISERPLKGGGWLKLRYDILQRDGFTCRYCGRSPLQHEAVKLHIDHLIPISQGGTNDPTNLVTACAECNLGKHDVLLSERVQKDVQSRSQQLINEDLPPVPIDYVTRD